MRTYNNNKLDVYEFLCQNAGVGYSNQEIAFRVGMSPSTTYTALKALIADELVVVDKATKKYRINALVADVYSRTIRSDDYEEYPNEQ